MRALSAFSRSTFLAIDIFRHYCRFNVHIHGRTYLQATPRGTIQGDAGAEGDRFVMAGRKRPTPRGISICLAVLALSLAWVQSASAFSIVEVNVTDFLKDRPLDTQLPSLPAGPATISLGVNTLSTLQGCLGFCSDSFDSLQISVPVGIEIYLTEFEITAAPPAPFGAAFVVLANDGSLVTDPANDPRFFPTLSILGTAAIGFNSNAVNEIRQSSLVLGAGLYDVVVLNGGINRTEARFFAGAVPEPGTAVLTGLGLVLLAARRRHLIRRS